MARKFHSRLNIFIDETGEFGFSGKSAKYYGVSLVIHEQNNDISKEISILEKRFRQLNFSDTFHMGDLLQGHEAFDNMDVATRKKLFFVMYDFSRKIKVSYHSIIFEKSFSNSSKNLKNKIHMTLADFISNHSEYLRSFDRVVVYYDSGQKKLASVIDDTFSTISNYSRKIRFDHREKKLFQVADLMTSLDKLFFKNDNGIKLTETENLFFSKKEIRSYKKAYEKKRFERTKTIRKAPFRVL